jgi:hypothetical protein
LTLITLNNQYARLRSVLEECRKAISVFSKDNCLVCSMGKFTASGPSFSTRKRGLENG